MSDESTQEVEQSLGWRAYQPSWGSALLMSLAWCGAFGLLSYSRTGDVVALEIALVFALPVSAFFRWLWPMFQHLKWSQPRG